MPTERNRFYSAPPSVKNVGNMYGWSDLAVNTGANPFLTGNWTALSVDANGLLNVNAGIQFTGALNATINSVGITGSVGNVAITGFSSTIAPQAVTGAIQGGNSIPLNVTGIIQTVVTGAIGGSVNVTNVTVSGFPSTIAPQAVSGFFTPIWTGSPNVTAAVTIGNVAITGAPVVTITGVLATTASVVVGNVAVTGGNGGVVITGLNSLLTFPVSNSVEQALLTTTNILLSGVSGSLAANLSSAAWVTGQIQLTGIVPVSITNTAPIAFSGAVQSTITNGVLPVTGNVIINSGTYAPVITGFTTQQYQIPVGTRQWSIAVESGSAYVNGVQINASTTLNGGGFDGRFTLSTAINVGTTGGRVLVITE